MFNIVTPGRILINFLQTINFLRSKQELILLENLKRVILHYIVLNFCKTLEIN